MLSPDPRGSEKCIKLFLSCTLVILKYLVFIILQYILCICVELLECTKGFILGSQQEYNLKVSGITYESDP